MKLAPKIIRTTFSEDILLHEKLLPHIMDNVKDVLLSQGLRLNSRKNSEMVFGTRIGHHLTYHPYFLVTKVKLKFAPQPNDTIDASRFTIIYDIHHIVPLILATLFSLLFYKGFNIPVTYFPFIIFFAYLVYIPTIHYSIFKKIITSISS